MSSWQDVTGTAVRAELVGFYAGFVYLRSEEDAFLRFPIERLDQAGQDRALDWARSYIELRRNGVVLPMEATWAKVLTDNLVQSDGEREAPFNPIASGQDPEFILLYFASERDRDAREFSPRLASVVATTLEIGYTNFLPIYVSRDRRERDYTKTLAELGWAGVRYADREIALLTSVEPEGIPSMVILDRRGNILLSASQDEEDGALGLLWRQFADILDMTNQNF